MSVRGGVADIKKETSHAAGGEMLSWAHGGAEAVGAWLVAGAWMLCRATLILRASLAIHYLRCSLFVLSAKPVPD